MAATFMLAAGLTRLQGWTAASYAFQGLIAGAFANGTCPWSDSA